MRLNDGDNHGQATHGARKHAWRTQAAWVNKQTNKESMNFVGHLEFFCSYGHPFREMVVLFYVRGVR